MKKYYSLLFTVFFSVSIMTSISCKKEINYEGISGELKGRVYLYDIDLPYNQKISDYSNVEVSVEGTSPLMKSTTTKDGIFIFSNLKSGVYDLVFTKNGYATYKKVSFKFVGGNESTILQMTSLYKLPDAKITDLKVDTGTNAIYWPYFYVTANLSNPNHKSYRFYISDKPDVSYNNYRCSQAVYPTNNSIQYSSGGTLINMLPSKTKLYMKMYPQASFEGSYTDIENGLQIYQVNTDQGSNTVEFVIPQKINY